MEYIQNNAIMIQLICTICMLLVTILYVVFTWIQSKYTKQAFLESIKQSKEDRQPYIVPTIERVSGVAFDASTYLRIQLSFEYALENVGDSSAVSVYTLLYARRQHSNDQKLVYAHLIPNYNYSIRQGIEVKDRIHFETDEFRDIVEDLEISHVKNVKRIETNPSQDPYKGPIIIMRVMYMNMMGQWFESMLEQELLELRFKLNEDKKIGKHVSNNEIKDKDVFEGYMINPCYSRLTRKMVTKEYVKDKLIECRKNAISESIFLDD